jgi:hypothetical protein
MSVIQLLSSGQKIKVNLSSRQIVEILNSLINAAAQPLFKHSHLMRQLILQALLQTQVDHRRKISIHDKTVAATCIIYGISQNNFDTIKLCELDRNILFQSILYIKPHLEEALVLERKLLRKPESLKLQMRQRAISKFTGIAPHLLTPIARWVFPYLELYKEFKDRIMEKYHKFAYQEANRARSYTKLFVDIEELYKNYLLAMYKAIDKMDATRGTLTNYIKQWLLSARSAPEFTHQYAVSYHLPSNVRKDMERKNIALTNMSVTLDDTHTEIEDYERFDEMQKIVGKDQYLLQCLRNIPGIKIPYLMIDIPIVLKPHEIEQLRGMQPA